MRIACLAVFLLALSPSAHARADESGQRVRRCVGAHGEVVFTGLACGAGELATGRGATSAAPPVADGCPASFADLRERLAGAISRHDPNSIAGMMRWQGIGGAAASDRLRRLRDLVKYPLLSIEGGSADGSGAPMSVRTGSHLDAGVREQTFGVAARGGCWWLTW